MRNNPVALPSLPCDPDFPCFSPALQVLLAACVHLGRTDTNALAAYLRRSPATINTQFRTINQCFGTSARADALLLTLNKRMIPLSPFP